MAKERERIFRRIRCRRIREIEKCLERRSVASADYALLVKEKKMLSLARLQVTMVVFLFLFFFLKGRG